VVLPTWGSLALTRGTADPPAGNYGTFSSCTLYSIIGPDCLINWFSQYADSIQRL